MRKFTIKRNGYADAIVLANSCRINPNTRADFSYAEFYLGYGYSDIHCISGLTLGEAPWSIESEEVVVADEN